MLDISSCTNSICVVSLPDPNIVIAVSGDAPSTLRSKAISMQKDDVNYISVNLYVFCLPDDVIQNGWRDLSLHFGS